MLFCPFVILFLLVCFRFLRFSTDKIISFPVFFKKKNKKNAIPLLFSFFCS